MIKTATQAAVIKSLNILSNVIHRCLCYVFNQATMAEGSFSCVCPVIDYEFRHNIVKVAVDQRGDSGVASSRRSATHKLAVIKD